MSRATKGRPRAKLPRRPIHAEIAPGLFEPICVIDFDAPVGIYAIDAMAHELLGPFLADPVREARMIIDIAGRSAHRWATHDLDAGAAYAAASVFDANLQLLLDRAGVLMRTDADRIAGIFDDDFEIDDDDLESPAERADEQARAIEDVIKEVALLRAKVEAFRKKYRVGRKPSLGNSKPLEHHFVLMMKQMWRATTKTNAPKSKDGRFARFVIAAWSDLEFDAREGIDDTLASYCETL